MNDLHAASPLHSHDRSAAAADAARDEAVAAWALLDAFFAAAPIGAAFLDRDLRYQRVNGALAAAHGMTPEQVLGRTLHEVVPQLAPLVEPLYQQVLETGEPVIGREITGPPATDPAGEAHYFVNYFRVQPEGREPLGVGLVALDMTDLRQAQERERVFAQVLEESRNEIYLFDAETLCFWQVNRGARENLGYTMDELRAMTPLDIKPTLSAAAFDELVEPLRSGTREVVRFETVHRRKDGTLYPVDVHLQRSTAGKRPIFVALIIDATERKQAEQELITAKEAAEQASQAKSQFLTVMSHELRTPLNAVLGYEDLLSAEISGPLTDKQKHQLSRIRSGANQLLDLINQLLGLARIESGAESVLHEQADAVELAREAASLMDALAAQKGLSLRVAVPDTRVPVRTDAGKLRQILLNLLGNAVKFTEQGEIELSLRVEAMAAVFRVRDTGPGIAAEYRERIFEPFVQVDLSQTRRHGGTGLGLAVSRELARLLGGELSLESVPGEGSTFVLALPRTA